MPITIGRELAAIGSICEPHNGPHNVVTIFYKDSERLVGKYDDQQGRSYWLGHPTATEQKVMADYGERRISVGQRIPEQGPYNAAAATSVSVISPAALTALPGEYEGRSVQFAARVMGGLHPWSPGRSWAYIDDYPNLKPMLEGALLHQWIDAGFAPGREYDVTFVGRVHPNITGTGVNFEVEEFHRAP
jgi:hypothetical protein